MIRKISISVLFFFVFIAVMSFTSKDSFAFALPDTGQTLCYDTAGAVIDCAGTGQDGEYNINPMSYTDNSNGTVTDNNTGIIWQQQDDGNMYNWYQASGTYDAVYNPNSQNVCGELILGGYSDWRMPLKKELVSIIDYSVPFPGLTINPIFTNTKAAHYWSSTTIKYYTGYGTAYWTVNSAGSAIDWSGNHNYYVRCVRGGQFPKQDFSDNGDGTIRDNATGLEWQQDQPNSMKWQDALNYCNGLELGGNSDWRLPNVKELESIVDETANRPSINLSFFPNSGAYFFMTSTTFMGHPTVLWIVDFDCGGIYNGYSTTSFFKSFNGYFRCVRGGSSIKTVDLAVTVDPAEGGTIASSPDGLVCSGNTCQGSFNEGTSVTLTASPNAGWIFNYWDDGTACYPENSRTIIMDGNKMITAKFSQNSKKTGVVVFIDGIQIIQVLFDPLSLWPGNYSQYLVGAIDDNSRELFEKKAMAITPFLWANTIYDTGAVMRLSQFLESWTNATNATGGPLVIVSHSWGTVFAYLAISTNSHIFVDKLITMGSPLEANSAVSMYSNQWLDAFGLLSFPQPSNVGKWHNYWAKCDPISARIHVANKNYQIHTNYYDLGSAYQTCHAAYFEDDALWTDILSDAYHYKK